MNATIRQPLFGQTVTSNSLAFNLFSALFGTETGNQGRFPDANEHLQTRRWHDWTMRLKMVYAALG
jgi:hypothetical protein